MKICFFGVGGVGGYYGTLMAAKYANIHDIYFVARGEHKDVICSSGLTLKKSGGNDVINATPKKCVDNLNDVPICDIIILSVKEYDLVKSIKEISKISNKNTIVLPLLNGVDIYERIKKHLKIGIVLSSCVYVGTHIESPGIIYQKGGSCKIHIGEDPSFPEVYPEQLLKLFDDCEIEFSWEKDVKTSIWSKYIFIASYGLVTAAYDMTLGEILDSDEMTEITKNIMNETNKIADKLSVVLDEDIVEKSYLKAKGFPYETKTSFQRDVESKGKLNESDLFAGTLIRYGKKLKVSTLNTEKVYNKLMANLA